jgi:hypothetical protein
MSEQNRPQFDPRFDPAFQRGFAKDARADGAVAGAAAVPGAPAVTPPVTVAAPIAAPSSAQAASSIVEHDEADAADAAPETSNRRARALLITISVIAVAFTLGGAWVFTLIKSQFSEASALSNQGDYYVVLALVFLAPLLTTLGLATGIGVLFSLWHRARRG